MFYRNGSSRNDGVCIYTPQSLNFQQLNFSHNTLNLIAVKCTDVVTMSHAVVCIYQAKSIDKQLFSNKFSSLLNDLTKYTVLIFILGDKKIDIVKKTHLTNEYLHTGTFQILTGNKLVYKNHRKKVNNN